MNQHLPLKKSYISISFFIFCKFDIFKINHSDKGSYNTTIIIANEKNLLPHLSTYFCDGEIKF